MRKANNINSRYLSSEELKTLSFKRLGENVKIARSAKIYDTNYISIGDDTIIDDYCVISGNVEMGKNVHLAHGCMVIAGRDGIKFEDFSGLAFGVLVFAQSDDYTGYAMTNPTVPMKYRKIFRAPVKIEKHVIVGAKTTVFPGVTLREGSSVGAMSMVTKVLSHGLCTLVFRQGAVENGQ